MGDNRDPETDQALPVANDSEHIVDLVKADLDERRAHGIRKYGVALQAGNGRDALLDLYQELLDATLYVRQAMEEDRRHAAIGRAFEQWVRSQDDYSVIVAVDDIVNDVYLMAAIRP